MTTTGSGVSTSATAQRATADAIEQAMKRLGPGKPTYGFLFAAPSMNLALVLAEARRLCPGTDFLGCTTAGEITEAGLTHGGLAAMLVRTEQQHVLQYSRSAAAPEEAARELGNGFFSRRRSERSGVSTTILLVDGLAGTGEAVVDCLREQAGGALHEIVGGAAADEGQFVGTYVGANSQVARASVAALHIVDQARWGVGVDHGLSPASPLMRVTRAEGNVVYELDGRPAFDVYKDYARTKDVELNADNAPAFFINNELGVVIFDQLRKARAPLGVGKDGSLKCAASLPVGANVCFLGGSKSDLVAAARRAATEARDRLGARSAAGVLVFDCICRGSILGSDFNHEIRAIREVFPEVPMAGFLTYGEIARYSGRLDGWHNTTAVVTAIPA